MEFRVLNTSLKGMECACNREEIRVGRAEENDVVLSQRSVSRHHATIRMEDGTPVVEDEDSRNETQVDGEAISTPTSITDGAIVSFGDVAVQVLFEEEQSVNSRIPSPASESSVLALGGEENGGLAGEELSEGTVSADPMAADAVAPREESGRPAKKTADLDSKLWPGLVIVLGLMVGAILVIFFYRASGQTNAPVDQLGLAIRLTEKKVVQVPAGFTQATQIRPPGALNVEQPLNLDIAVSVEAKSQGLATARLENERGEFVLLHVNVLPRAEENVEKLFSESLDTRSERLEVARKCMRQGEGLRKEAELYEAMVQYERAVQVMEPLSSNPPAELRQADIWRQRLEEKIQKQYDQLTFEMSTFMRGGDKKMALQRLEDIRRLIPDE
ncbi:MAG: FHA domain-containing protein, partial [Planctomycetota bacterium]